MINLYIILKSQFLKKNTKDEKINTIAIEIFSQFVEVVPTLVREFILKEVESRVSISRTSSAGSNIINSKQPTTPISSFSFASSASSLSTSTTPQPPPVLLSSTTSSGNGNGNGNASKDETATTSTSTTTTTTSTSTITATTTQSVNSKATFQITSLSSILNLESESFEPVLINFVIRQMINDPDQGNSHNFLVVYFNFFVEK